MPKINLFKETIRPSAIELNRMARFIEGIKSSDGSLLITYNEDGQGNIGSIELNLGPKAFNTLYNALVHDETSKEYVGKALKPYVLPDIPSSGTYALYAVDGEVQWVEVIEYPPES